MIGLEQFIVNQPAAPRQTKTDGFYLDIANRLLTVAKKKNLFPSYPEKVVERAALSLIGYYQDVIADAGIWHAFIDECRRMYGFPVPFYTSPDSDYLDYEMNPEDVRFMVWYSLSMNDENHRDAYPMDSEILEGADEWWSVLDAEYEDAPLPEDYCLAKELEMHSLEDREDLYRLGNWLFLHCYLMTPAYAMTLSQKLSGIDFNNEMAMAEVRERLEQSMGEDPTGPLALFLSEWLHLIVDHKPRKTKKKADVAEHKYYRPFVEATGGDVIKIFSDYEDMNNFFIEVLGWEPGIEHLAQLKGAHDYVLMVNREKGMLVAKDVARCIAKPDNDLYDKSFAEANAYALLMIRGVCPGDLLKYICKNGWLPDASFPGSNDRALVSKNQDFIARCYLQQYYTGD